MRWLTLLGLLPLLSYATAAAPGNYVSSGPVARYDPMDWSRIYALQASWGNAIGPPAGPGEYWCAHAAYDVVGLRLSVISGGREFICVTGDTVQDRHKAQWWAKWGLETSYNFFYELPDPGYVEVYEYVSEPAQATERHFPETNRILSGPFLTFWEANGGLPIFGYPLTEVYPCELEDDTKATCQMFERARFEMLEDETILLGRVGAEVLGR